MEFSITIKDLIMIIGEKYNLEITDDFFTELKNSRKNKYPKEFLEEINQIIGSMSSKACNNEVIFESIEDMHKIIPEDYFNKIKPTDEDGQKVMSFSELRDAMHKSIGELEEPNNNDNLRIVRDRLKASYVHDDYPVYNSLEHSWRMLETDYEVIDRENQPADDPLSSFSYYVSMGFYPPPEIMLIIGSVIERYYDAGGDESLDEIFFGEKYKKTKNASYKQRKRYTYYAFHHFIRLGKSNLTLEKKMEEIIASNDPATLAMYGIDQNTDIDTYLRSYRRWKKELKEGKYN